MHFPPVKEQLDIIVNNTVEVISTDELEKKLQKSIVTGTPLKIKLGADPSRPDLHLGHSVVLRKLREFQDLGHEAILIIGDFTAMIGDPSGKSKTRPQLTAGEARENGKSYFEQASKILDPEKTTICYNADWLGKMQFADVIRLASHYTVARMLERDDFEKRYRSQTPISIHEFLYPLAQGMDSVHLKNDVELGGTDQKFNLLVGRDLQREYGIEPQVCITMPLLVGTDGTEKMSKSLGNAICFNDTPEDMYGRTLSIPDTLIEKYWNLLAAHHSGNGAAIAERIAANPRETKRELAREVVAQYYSADDAARAEEHFDRVIVNKQAPDDLVTVEFEESSMPVVELLMALKAFPSKNEARRMIQQGAVQAGEEKITDINAIIEFSDEPVIIRAGKRKFFKVAGGKKTF
ncbi:tyrosine--tRNA ligase [Chlorobaculum sp. 24CR]|uniref:tyrosine--tRNA ligase n=1 Tax=Chlorobaculum sp. 24CR TaxID=2508878 RepID=UPI00100AF380|nr:tyrosine--tRNA ligase [Chlorobaculum sp. 24CR]RXK84610.1 tyrosine--tRNA ligase [Chlorobaculum sp. 24CR]